MKKYFQTTTANGKKIVQCADFDVKEGMRLSDRSLIPVMVEKVLSTDEVNEYFKYSKTDMPVSVFESDQRR